MNLPELVLATALTLVCIAAAVSDVLHRRVPNGLCGITALAGLGSAALVGGLPLLTSHLVHLAIVLVAGMILFRLGVFGGGDAKFYAAVAGWFALPQAVLLLLAITLCGLVLLIVWFSVRRLRGVPITRKAGVQTAGLPYAVAIGAGAVLTMFIVSGGA